MRERDGGPRPWCRGAVGRAGDATGVWRARRCRDYTGKKEEFYGPQMEGRQKASPRQVRLGRLGALARAVDEREAGGARVDLADTGLAANGLGVGERGAVDTGAADGAATA